MPLFEGELTTSVFPVLGVFAKQFLEMSVHVSSCSAQNSAPIGKIFYLEFLLIFVNTCKLLVETGQK
jgi:hypothetical protein